jgi:hypothetical protein
MALPFFIFGFPRSRTAWLSNWFTGGGSFCWHDEDPRVLDVSSPADRWCGLSDSLTGLNYSTVFRTFPLAPFALIERDIGDVHNSVMDMGMGIDPNRLWARLYELELAHAALPASVLRIPYAELDDMAVIQTLERHLTPGRTFDERRWRMLDGLRVEICEHKYVVQPNS